MARTSQADKFYRVSGLDFSLCDAWVAAVGPTKLGSATHATINSPVPPGFPGQAALFVRFP